MERVFCVNLRLVDGNFRLESRFVHSVFPLERGIFGPDIRPQLCNLRLRLQ